MGAFNACEIRQLKQKFNSLSNDHNMLVRVTQQHNKDIQNLANSMQDIMELIDLMANYNPGQIIAEIDKALAGYHDRVTKVTNAIQQLQHHRLSVDLLTPEQINIIHSEVEQAAAYEGLNNLAAKTSDYFQVEVTYVRSEDDIVIIVHVPCIKVKGLLKIFRYLSFPIPLPFSPPANDLTIGQAMTMQNQTFSESQMDQIFDSNLNFPQVEQALFITDSADIISIGTDDDYHVLTQLDLASCTKRNHIYLCDKLQVMRTDLTETCLGSLFLRVESGVRAYCKFETRPVQEVVYQLTDREHLVFSPTDQVSDREHLVFSPTDQVSKIKCKNGTQERVQLDRNQATKITMEPGCTLKLNKHTIRTKSSSHIYIQPLQYSWSWNPFNLPSSTLANTAHLDELLYKVQKQVFNLTSEIANHTISESVFNKMLNTSTFSINPTSIIIWALLCSCALLYLTLFLVDVYIYIKHKQNKTSTLLNLTQSPENVPLVQNSTTQNVPAMSWQDVIRYLNNGNPTPLNLNPTPNYPLCPMPRN